MKVPRGDAWRYIKVPCKNCKKMFTRHARNQRLCSRSCYRGNGPGPHQYIRPTAKKVNEYQHMVRKCQEGEPMSPTLDRYLEHPEFVIKFLSHDRQRKAFRDAAKSAAVAALIDHGKPAGIYYISIAYKMIPGDKGIGSRGYVVLHTGGEIIHPSTQLTPANVDRQIRTIYIKGWHFL